MELQGNFSHETAFLTFAARGFKLRWPVQRRVLKTSRQESYRTDASSTLPRTFSR